MSINSMLAATADAPSQNRKSDTALPQGQQTARSIPKHVRRAFLPTSKTISPLRVLVVDDHLDAAESLSEVLDLLGCSACACSDSKLALAVAAKFQPQVCLLDLMMPRMDGIELAQRLKAQAGGRPLLLVAVTALGDEEIRARTALAGFHYHLVKPVDAATLKTILTELGERFSHSDSENAAPE